MKGPNTAFRTLAALLFAFTLVLALACGTGPAQAKSWFKVAGGVSGMAMDDINNGHFSFYNTPGSGYDFPALDSGFSFSLHLGYDLTPDFALGFSWDRQHAHVEGIDNDITADLNLDANFFMAHLYWTPLKTGRWDIGAGAGLGLAFPDGDVKETGPNNVNYGEGETTGSSAFAMEIMAVVDYALSESMFLELTAGWRDATIDEIRLDGAPVQNANGSNLKLDYAGYTLKAGVKFKFG